MDEAVPGTRESDTKAVVRELAAADMNWAEAVMDKEFGGRMQSRRGELVDALGFGGLVATDPDDSSVRVGLLTYRVIDHEAEIIAFAAVKHQVGIGSVLLNDFLERAEGRRVWLVTTNDNIDALRFYQRRGFAISDLRPGAVDAARASLKPGIPTIGDYDIPVRDEIELTFDPSSGAL